MNVNFNTTLFTDKDKMQYVFFIIGNGVKQRLKTKVYRLYEGINNKNNNKTNKWACTL